MPNSNVGVEFERQISPNAHPQGSGFVLHDERDHSHRALRLKVPNSISCNQFHFSHFHY